MFYGFDLFFQVTGCGLNLENFLLFCKENNFLIDWFNFQRTSLEKSDWNYSILVDKLKYSIIDIYGEDYWLDLEQRFKIYFIKYCQENLNIHL